MLEWESRDPIPRFEFYLEKKGHELARLREQIDERVRQAVQQAVDFAEQSPLPEPKEALEDLYATPVGPDAIRNTAVRKLGRN